MVGESTGFIYLVLRTWEIWRPVGWAQSCRTGRKNLILLLFVFQNMTPCTLNQYLFYVLNKFSYFAFNIIPHICGCLFYSALMNNDLIGNKYR